MDRTHSSSLWAKSVWTSQSGTPAIQHACKLGDLFILPILTTCTSVNSCDCRNQPTLDCSTQVFLQHETPVYRFNKVVPSGVFERKTESAVVSCTRHCPAADCISKGALALGANWLQAELMLETLAHCSDDRFTDSPASLHPPASLHLTRKEIKLTAPASGQNPCRTGGNAVDSLSHRQERFDAKSKVLG